MMNELNVKALDILDKYPVQDRLVIVNIRANNKTANLFDDTTMLVFNDSVLAIVESTCDAGTPNLKNPVNKDGAAIVMNGFYPKLWKIGSHRGKYEALVQNAPVIVFRDNNKDNVLDYPDRMITDVFLDVMATEPNIVFREGDVNHSVQRGMFGINLHRASSWRELEEVGLYSAGCCVIRKPTDFDKLLVGAKDILKQYDLTTIDALYVTESLINTYNY